jgi:ABC-type oligopeptide transport system substrate-binding subunit
MIQGIQAGIGTVLSDSDGNKFTMTFKVETMSEDEIASAISSNSYDIAFYPFKSSTPSAISYLSSLANNKKTSFSSDVIEKYLTKAEKAKTTDEKAKYIQQAETAIIETYSFYPMLFETSYYGTAKGVSAIQFHAGSGRVSFVNATREK